MQNKLNEGFLLDEKGNLSEAGYAFSLVKKYDRNMIKAPKFKIKEWDYYYIGNNHRGVAFTIDDNSYMGLGSVSILNFDEASYITKSSMKFFTNGKVNLPPSSAEGITEWTDKNYHLVFKSDNGVRVLDVDINNYNENKPFKAHFELKENNEGSMVIATPFNKEKHFYYNQKINSMIAKGYYLYGDERYEFSDTDTRAVLDWGRGVWTYKNTWYWASLNNVSNGNEVGFNLGYGFGDTSKASENMLFYNSKAYKLDDVRFNIPMEGKKYKYMEPWTFTSSDGSIDLTFTPIVDRMDCTDIIIIKSLQHQVFGVYNGTIKVDEVEAKIENVVGFAERVTNYW